MPESPLARLRLRPSPRPRDRLPPRLRLHDGRRRDFGQRASPNCLTSSGKSPARRTRRSPYCLILESLLPDQGGLALAGHRRLGSRVAGRGVFPLFGAFAAAAERGLARSRGKFGAIWADSLLWTGNFALRCPEKSRFIQVWLDFARFGGDVAEFCSVDPEQSRWWGWEFRRSYALHQVMAGRPVASNLYADGCSPEACLKRDVAGETEG